MSGQIEDILFRYFTDQLNKEEEEYLLKWLDTDISNKNLLYEMSDWWAAAHVPLFMSDLKVDFQNHLKKLTTKSDPLHYTKSLNPLFKWWGKIAATVLIILTTGFAAYYYGRTSVREEISRPYYEASVPLGSQSKVVLPDRTVVWLNAGSSIKYYEDPEIQTRNISLAGEAYFEVRKNTDKPFIVESGSLKVSVTGTSFNIKAYDNQETIDIVLVSGEVIVHTDQLTENGYCISPDEMLTYNKKTNTIKSSTVNSLNHCAWKKGQLKFEEQLFTVLANDLERIYNVKIKIESEQLKNERFSGSFLYKNSINSILREIDVDNKYTWKKNGTDITIFDKNKTKR